MNNGPGKHTLPQRNPPSSISTRGSRRPSTDTKLASTDGEQSLIQANISGIRSREAALDYAAKVGLFVAADSTDPIALGTRLYRSLLITARRVQEFSGDLPSQDAVWAIRYIYVMIQELWQNKYNDLQNTLNEERKKWKDEREALQAALATEKQERQQLSMVDWTAEPSVDANEIAEKVTGRVLAALSTHATSSNKSAAVDTAKLDALHQRLSILDNTVKLVGAAVESLSNSQPGQPSYASVTAASPPPNPYAGRSSAEQDAVARTGLQERRVLIMASDKRPNAWLDNTPTQHVAKARFGIEAAHAAHTPPAPLDDVKAVTPTHAFRAGKHGVVLSFATKEAADWFSSPDVWGEFIKKYEGDVTLKPRLFMVVLRNLPVSYDPSLPDFKSALCDDNTMPTAWVDSVRWMKPAARRTDDQRSAHALVAFRTAEAANEILDRGTLAYDGGVYRVERLIRDSPRCARCQKHGHFAAKCKGDATCGLCAGKGHHSNDCVARGDPKCATCSVTPDCDANHPSWARECPARLRALEKLQNSHPEDFEPRFLTSSNASSVFAARLAPFVSVTQHRPPQNASGAQKFSKPAPAIDNAAKKKPGAKKQTQNNASRPSTPAGSEGGASRTRSRAPSTASTASTPALLKATKKPPARQRKSSASAQDVEDALASQAGPN